VGSLNLFSDKSGLFSQSQVNGENIKSIIDELNRNSNQLDSVNNSLGILSSGQSVVNISAGTGSTTVSLGTTAPASFICYMSRPDLPGRFFALPYVVNENPPTPTIDMVVTATLVAAGGLGTNVSLQFQAFANTATYSPPASVTCYYYTFSQPVNPAGS
jgi:hypothetical protein